MSRELGPNEYWGVGREEGLAAQLAHELRCELENEIVRDRNNPRAFMIDPQPGTDAILKKFAKFERLRASLAGQEPHSKPRKQVSTPRRRGQVKPRGDGRWLVTVFVGRRAGKREYRAVTVYGTREDAEDRLQEMLTKRSAGKPIVPDKRPFGEFLDWYLDHVKRPRVRTSTLASYREIVDRYIKPDLGSVRLDRLESGHFEALTARLTGRGLSNATIWHAFFLVRGAIAEARKRCLMRLNPLEEIRLPAPPRPRKDLRPIPGLERLGAALSRDHLSPMWKLLLTTGLFPSEILGLRWLDLDFDLGTLTVQRVLSRPGSGPAWEFGSLRGHRRARVVELDAGALAELRAHQERQTAARERMGGAYRDHGLIFANEIGEPLDWSNVRHRHFAPALKRSGLTGVTPLQLVAHAKKRRAS